MDRALVYVAGSPHFVESVAGLAISLGVSASRIVTERIVLLV